MSKAISKLSIESRRKATDEILEKMNDTLTGNQLLLLNKVLNEEFNKVDFLVKENTIDMASISEKNQRLLKSFLDAKTVEGLSERTLYKYEHDIQHLLDWLIVSLDDCTTEDIREFLSMWKSKGNCSNITIDGLRKTFSTFFRYLSDNGFIYKNPMVRIHKIKSRKLYKKAFSGYELELLRNSISSDDFRMKAIFELLLSSGIRISELANIKLGDVNFEDMTFKVLGKGNKERKCYFNDKAKLALQKYIKSRKDLNRWNKGKWEGNDYLFVTDHKPYNKMNKNSLGKLFRKLGAKSGVDDVHAHRFRRTCATIYLNRGMPIEQVQKLLGHESISTTQLYINVNEEAVRLNHDRYTN